MDIYVIGNPEQVSEIERKLASQHSIHSIDHPGEIQSSEMVAVFDLSFDDSPESLLPYETRTNTHLVVNATRISLAELAYFGGESIPNLYGLAADPTFLERPIMELSAYSKNKVKPEEFINKLGAQITLVDDRVGLVTPRIIAMIINEAYYTVQEGTANKADIDTGMRLGTNYPLGPFEWVQKWGLANIYELLEALYLHVLKILRSVVCFPFFKY